MLSAALHGRLHVNTLISVINRVCAGGDGEFEAGPNRASSR